MSLSFILINFSSICQQHLHLPWFSTTSWALLCKLCQVECLVIILCLINIMVTTDPIVDTLSTIDLVVRHHLLHRNQKKQSMLDLGSREE